MEYLGLILFCFIITFSFLIARAAGIATRNLDKGKISFWKRETESNQSRKSDISNLNYVSIPLDKLSINSAMDAGMSEEIDTLKALSDKRIINLSHMTNTDLKLEYGVANLTALSEYDNNYTTLILLLNTIGNDLADKDTNAAISFLEYAVDIDSNISATYSTLARLYKNECPSAIDTLIHKAKSLNTMNKRAIINKITTIKNS